MYKFEKILVGLDQSDMDTQLIDAVCKVCQMSGSKEVYFINFIRDFHMPEELQKEFPDLLQKAIDERLKQIKLDVERIFTCPGVNVNYIVRQGQPTKEIMNFAHSKEIDLIVLGRKNEKPSGGVIINRLARRATCSLMIIPRGQETKLDKILVPSDFSDYSKDALEKAVELARNNDGETEIVIQNVYQVPSGYHYTGKTFDEFADVMVKHAEKDFKKFVSGLDLSDVKTTTLYTLDRLEDVITYIYSEARSQEADIVIIGAKGRTAAAALFIGSKAEKLIQINQEIPMIIVRPKGKSAGFREYLKEL